ncbi:hypothetical protein J2046_002630 [Rhizobium petrolearium]|nr:hypothetical protein [Neorhizobium petrolearium]
MLGIVMSGWRPLGKVTSEMVEVGGSGASMSPVRKRGLIIAMSGIPTLTGLLRVIQTGRIIFFRAPLGGRRSS